MHEIVYVGSAAWVDESVRAGQERVERFARDLEIIGRWEVATDPFFLPEAEGKALLQKLQETKLEYRAARLEAPLMSVNRHGDFFGERFAIRDAHGEAAHTACIAAGLDRWLTLRSGGTPGCASSPPFDPQVIDFVRRTLPQLGSQPWEERRLAELGLDSLDYVELFCALHDDLGVDLSTDAVEGLQTVADLAELISRRLDAQRKPS